MTDARHHSGTPVPAGGGASYDALVVGGGIAGLCAALRLAELGARVCVIEKGVALSYPCNSRMTGGAFHLAMGSLDRPVEEMVRAFARPGDPAHAALVGAVAARAGSVVGWLRGHGVSFMRGGPLGWQRWVLAPPAMARPGYDWSGRAGDHLLRVLSARLESLGGAFRYSTRARRILRHSDVISGLAVETPDGPAEIGGHVVVLADGGFQGDPDLVATHVARHVDEVTSRGAGTGNGDGLRMASALGAKLTDMHGFYGHLLAYAALRNQRLNPFPFIDYLAAAGFLAGSDGRRLFDEGKGGVYLANRIAARDSREPIYAIFDEAAWEGPGRAANCPCNPYLAREDSGLVAAESIGALAAALRMDAGQLTQTVEEFNQAVAAERPEGLSPPRSIKRFKPIPLLHAPFYAIRVCAGLTYTMGGIAISPGAEVIDAQGRPIPGLFAAGTTVGGLEGGPDLAYMGGLTRSVATALAAAESGEGYLHRARAAMTVEHGVP